MEGIINDYQLTRFGRVRLLFLAVSLLLVITCWCLYGFIGFALLCGTGGLAYCCLTFLCYYREAEEWRKRVDQAYGKLFLTLLRHSPTIGTNKRNVQVSQPCHKEAQKIIQLIMRDLVLKWYENMTDDSEFPEDVQKILEHLALETNVRLQNIDLDKVVCELLSLVLPYLEVVNAAGTLEYNGVTIFDVNHEASLRAFENNSRVAHRALRNPETESRYYRQAIDTLIQSAVPSDYKNCDAACIFIREVLLEKIVEPLIGLLCDPDFLNEAIPIVLSKAPKEKIERELQEIERENEVLENQVSRGRLLLVHKQAQLQRRRFHSHSGRFNHTFIADSPLVILPSHLEASTTTTSSATSSFYGLGEHTSSPSVANGNGTPGNRLESSYEDDEEDGLYVSLPPIFVTRHIRVEKEGTMHIGYIFKFPKWMLTAQNLKVFNTEESDTHLQGMKRYSDFVKFHSTIQKSPLSIFIKDIELPEKRGLATLVTKLPFTSGNLDPTILLERKQGLERYLQSVSSIDEVQKSEVFQNFLTSGVKLLKEATPQKQSGRKKATFVVGVKAQSSTDSGSNQARLMESVLCTYLNTRLPLPCRSMHSAVHTESEPLDHHQLDAQPPDHHQVDPKPPNHHQFDPKPPNHHQFDAKPPNHHQLDPKPPNHHQFDPNHHQFDPKPPNHHQFDPKPHNHHQLDAKLPNHHQFDPKPPNHHQFDDKSHAAWGSSEKLPDQTPESSVGSSIYMMTDDNSMTAGVASMMCSELPGGTVSTVDGPVFTSGIGETIPQKQHSDVTTYPNMEVNTHFHLGCEEEDGEVHSNESRQDGGHPPSSNLSAKDRERTDKRSIRSLYIRLQLTLNWFLSKLIAAASYLVFVVNQVATSHPQTTQKLAREQEHRTRMTNALFSLGTEASRMHCPELWATGENTQLAILATLGGGMERFLWKELHETVYSEENWTRALFHLRRTLWPGGKLDDFRRKQRNEEERKKLRINAAEAFKDFLPNFFPFIVGPSNYNKAVRHCIGCLQNPRINRHFLLRIIDLLLTKLVPEIQEKDFQNRLSRLRTITSVSSSRRFSRQTIASL